VSAGRTARIGALGTGIVAGVAWWAAVLLGLRPVAPPGPAPSGLRAAVSYMPLQSFAPPERPDARAIWSPVLFSLPTPAGFSREVEAGPVARPPLEPAPEPPPLLARRAAAVDEAGVSVPAVPLPSVPAGPRPAPPPPPVAAIVPVEGRLPPGVVFPVPAALAGPSAWEAEVRVAFDDSGMPARAFIEPGDAPAAARAETVRSVMRWRRPAGPAGWVVARLVHPGTTESPP